MTKYNGPTVKDILWPTLKALEATGGSASNEELSEEVAAIMKLSDDVLDVLHKDGPLSEVDYRAAWARSHLKLIGAIDNSSRGVWALTDKGRQVTSENEVKNLVRKARFDYRKNRKQSPAQDSEEIDENNAVDETWEQTLLSILQNLEPAAFERLCQRVLRESGFTKVEVTGRTGDGGIDGSGVLRVNLLSFQVRFQCKKYTGSVGAPDIRDFRGAMVGRGDKGLFITTGRFTKDAEREAVRDGAPAIDLIDGIELCQLLKALELGVETRTVESITPISKFFKSV